MIGKMLKAAGILIISSETAAKFNLFSLTLPYFTEVSIFFDKTKKDRVEN